MHRAKHRAAARSSADVLATTLIERFAVASPEGATRHAVAPRGGVLLLDAPARAVPAPRPADSLFGAVRPPAVPTPRLPSLALPAVRPQPVTATLAVTVLGAAAAVSAVAAPPAAVESTAELAPVQAAAPAPEAAGTVLAEAAPAPAAAPEQPTLQVDRLVTGVTGEMQKLTPAVEAQYETVANATALSAASPAAVRKAAMSNALSKIGKPYRWGAVGPNAFDCSGLVKWSFGASGKSLPRTSRAMSRVGTPVSKADLQPGDLVFFYKPISHVGIYIGNGKIVHASRKGQPVKVSDMSRMKFSGARRV